MRRKSSRPTSICVQCATEFLPPLSHLRAGGGRYCSRRCHYASLGIPIGVDPLDRMKVIDDCWVWQGRVDRKGYGEMERGTKRLFLHHLAWERASGMPVPPGMCVLHTCDNPPCIRNDEPGTYEIRGILLPRFGHLALGTQLDNVADMISKGRRATIRRGKNRPGTGRGRQNRVNYPFAKLTPDQVLEMRRTYSPGDNISALSRQYGVSRKTIRLAVTGVTWTHV